MIDSSTTRSKNSSKKSKKKLKNFVFKIKFSRLLKNFVLKLNLVILYLIGDLANGKELNLALSYSKLSCVCHLSAWISLVFLL